MTCESCENKSKKVNKDFTRAVIEINNPEEQIVLLRKVVIPTSMGTEEQVPAAVGKYRNVVLKYEANNHVYIYSSDGIPTLLEMGVPQEVWDSIEELQQEIDDIKNNPDVVDIVATYADLQAYDTSDLGDKDVIRVLTDETHDDESSYYRWSTATQTWTFIGATGPYYTKDEVDDLLDEEIGDLSSLETTDKSNAVAAINEVNSKKGIGVLEHGDKLWELEPGMYIQPENSTVSIATTLQVITTGNENRIYIVSGKNGDNREIWRFDWDSVTFGGGFASGGAIYVTDDDGVMISNYPQKVVCFDTLFKDPFSRKLIRIGDQAGIDGNITYATAIGYYALAKGERSISIGPSEDTSNPTTANGEDSISIGSTARSYSGGVSIGYQAGHSSNSSSSKCVNIGYQAGLNGSKSYGVSIGAYSKGSGEKAVAIGTYASASGDSSVSIYGGISSSAKANASGEQSVAIGLATASGIRSVAIGNGANAAGQRAIAFEGKASAKGSVAIGAGSMAEDQGVVDFSDTSHPNSENWGYNNTDYRLLTGVHDPQNAHDAATKGYVDTAIAAAGGANTINSTDWSALWQ